MDNGFNEMRWKCDRDGCFNVKRRPKIEVFCECFPRRINFGDVDGLVELCGAFCLLEWKGEGGVIRRGQEMSYLQFTKVPGNIVFILNGNAETMVVSSYLVFWNGKRLPQQAASLDDVKQRIRKWVEWTEQKRRAA